MKSLAKISVQKVIANENNCNETDVLAVEEPLEIRLGFYEKEKFTHKAISITMRTPDHDFELAAGFLFTEGILQNSSQIKEIKHCGKIGKEGFENTVRVDLQKDVKVDFKRLERHFYTSSSCGVCGKSSIEALQTGVKKIESNLQIQADLIHQLPEILRESQTVFNETGGLHASALFDENGDLEIVREDVGRHNALDKVIGAKFLANQTQLSDKILLVSGRASFELVQKALMAQITILAAVGSPSSLAVELAKEFGMTLVGFVRDNRFNIYCGGERLC
ncbi:MAG TPA: formate dehydrogenase accessory sulfurtransferase FdhD [Pyrinomonadaceae bacterium]|nr:formate dehydrogenase accessory sulfurtransferase FdhD [Pyrinomonadaceae bacterium]